MNTQIYRRVKANVISSSYLPRIRIKIDDAFLYVGKLQFNLYQRALVDKSKDSYIKQFLRSMDDNYRKNTVPKRKVIDCIAGMTDDFFNSQYDENFVPQSYGYQLT